MISCMPKSSVLLHGFIALLMSVVWNEIAFGQGNGSLRPVDGLDHGSVYREAQQLFEQTQYEASLIKCDLALNDNLPVRIFNSIQATAIRCCLRLNRRDEAVQRVETIWKRDDASPFLNLLPLVWDDRLPTTERYVATPRNLRSQSLPRQLAAASSLLHDPQHQQSCVKILTDVRASRRLPMSVLAETQLWRLGVRKTDDVRLSSVQRWKTQADSLPQSQRAGPQFVVGRALQLRQQPDPAALAFLWAPMMQTDDAFLAATGLAEAIVCLESTGRRDTAQRLRQELQHRFGHTSAAQLTSNSQPDQSSTAQSQ